MNKLNAFGMTGLLRRAMVLAAIVGIGSFGLTVSAQAGQVNQSLPGSYSWTPPAGVTSATIEVWGGGGAGGGDNLNDNFGGAGGGGGAYSKSTITVVPGTPYNYTVGIGGSGANTSAGTVGGDSWFSTATTVMAKGGSGGGIYAAAAGAGGAASSGFGTTKLSGGAGLISLGAAQTSAKAGGGGGGSAGTASNGNPATTNNTGATAVAGGGAGGDGGPANQPGLIGGSPGGGGGGSGNNNGNKAGGAGEAGKVVINWGPTVTINQASAQVDPTNASPFEFDVVFSDPVTGFDSAADVTLTGTATGKSFVSITGSGTTYTVRAAATGGGTVIASIPAGAAVGSFGNASFVSTSTDNTVTFLTGTSPTLTINQAGGQADPTNGTITYTAIFNDGLEAVTGFTDTDVVLSGTGIASVTSVTGGPSTYTVTVTAIDSGTIIATIPAGAAVGTATRLGLSSLASTSSDNTVTFDNLKPDVSINQGAAQADPALASPVTFDVLFSEPVTGFASGDVVISGTSTDAAVSGVAGGPSSYTVTVTATINGTIIASIPAGAAVDLATNTSTVASSVDNEIDFQGGSCVDPSPSTLAITYVAGTDAPLFGPSVVLSTLFSATNLTGFSYTIAGLSVNSPWDSSAYGIIGFEDLAFVVSATDPDCGGVVKSDTKTIRIDNSSINYLIHNSVTTGSGTTKWPLGWGVSGGKYGEFTCATCHKRGSTNIKRIRQALPTIADAVPESPIEDFPGTDIFFSSTVNNSANFGDDNLGHTTSTRVCEVCHSKNDFHNYDTANNTGSLNHANQSDCIRCHTHKQGFKAPGCSSCHGNPPTGAANMVFSPAATGALVDAATAPGAHATHAVTKGMGCLTCHKGNTMPDVSTTIQMGFEANATNVPGWNNGVGDEVVGGTIKVYNNLTNGYTFASSEAATTVSPVADQFYNCTVYCHGNWSGNAGSNNTPSWVGNGQAVCGSCHGATGANPPTTGSHVAHAASSGVVKLACNKCHPSYIDSTHVNGDVAWQLATVDGRIGASAQYSGTASGTTGAKAPSASYGTCTTVYCHGANAPNWGTDVGKIFCNSCHSASSVLEGTHNMHYNSATVATANVTGRTASTSNYIFGCGTCHQLSGTTHVGGTISAVQSSELSLAGGGTYTPAGVAAGTSPDRGFNYTAGTCGFNSCHNDGKAVPGAPRVVAQWTTTLPTDCTGCHRNNAASGFAMNTNGHPAHVSDATVMSIKPCQMCHDATVDADDRLVTDKDKHLNSTRDIAILGTWDSDAIPANNWDGTSCTAVYCHSNGQAVATRTYSPINWTTTIGCTGCHGGAGTTTTLTAQHLAHVGTDPSNTNKQFGYTCNVCHVATAVNNSAIANLSNHINVSRDVSVNVASGGTGTIGTDYGEDIVTPRPLSCGTTKCHGSASPDWGTATVKGDCSACHGMSKLGQVAPLITVRDTNGQVGNSDPQVGAHSAHLNALSNYSVPITCNQCHLNVVTAMSVQATYVNKVNAVGHIDSSTPAELSFGGLATNSAQTTATYGTPFPAGSCNNYCHGNTLIGAADPNPSWDQNGYLTGTLATDCNRCHGAPPPGKGHLGNEEIVWTNTGANSCGTVNCHDQTMNTNGTFKTVALHIDGTINSSAVCTTCHGSLPPNTGSHQKHGIHLFEDLAMNYGPDLGTADWNEANYPLCAACHDMTDQAFHFGATSNIMGVNKPTEAFGTTPPNPLYNDTNKNCFNARCHFKPTPNWFDPALNPGWL